MNRPSLPIPEDAQAVQVVDDDAGTRQALDSLFRSVGYGTRLHRSALEFLDSGDARLAGCLVLDVRLPGLSGLDLQGQLNEAGVTMPVALMTGHGDIPMTVQGMKAGAVDFLPKPFRDQAMLDAVASALARHASAHAERGQADELRARLASLSPQE
jgi:FixJ family two-component response regulator